MLEYLICVRQLNIVLVCYKGLIVQVTILTSCHLWCLGMTSANANVSLLIFNLLQTLAMKGAWT